jgi:site-specific DNA-methyltransferase (adenine-specific)
VYPKLKPTATLYVCTDWTSSSIIQEVLEEFFYIQNRLTWQREKGRGSQKNWKNSTEDIWFATVSKKRYFFDAQAVKMKRRVKAPYRQQGQPKDWQKEKEGKYRWTYPSNFWSDITIPFWSMPENTAHPTQKPEKLLAKLILASSRPGDIVFDSFLGSGTTSTVAKKLDRQYVGIEIDPYYAAITEKRLAIAANNPHIQGFQDGIFWCKD